MMLRIAPVSPRDTRVGRLLQQSQDLMRSLFAPEENNFLEIEALCAPEITLFAAEQDGRLWGCAALRRCDGYGEVKSMFVDPEARGRGVGAQLLAHLEAEAKDEGLVMLRLETGRGLDAAARLYEARGFEECGPFGGYKAIPASRFFEKILALQPL
ncbi:GNAT family N-acetyltransferase [Puniceibacterium sp. IMCC21224]|uniref:GNAT family N-acetyltransferase n=1 Tax=Puniceibacterium sp. IMCC21224 TaxID=1618204 RepID=UPI00064DD1EC|nr:GNAT family N-acetyltransferase [Puniceibacterium sp. IMCC21224]KMK65866.1 acetyltransferase (GNAT) family protein [Puniceibacterium sp. IMCC21224]